MTSGGSRSGMSSLEHADDPAYPAAMTGLAYRFAMNYVVYSMTH